MNVPHFVFLCLYTACMEVLKNMRLPPGIPGPRSWQKAQYFVLWTVKKGNKYSDDLHPVLFLLTSYLDEITMSRNIKGQTLLVLKFSTTTGVRSLTASVNLVLFHWTQHHSILRCMDEKNNLIIMPYWYLKTTSSG